MPWQDVCPSVHLCITRWCFVEMAKHIIKVFSLTGRQIIVVFPYQKGWQYSDGYALMGVSNARGTEKS